MDIVQRLIALGIREDGPADIFLSSKRQFQLINDFQIDLRADKNTQYRCIIAANHGDQVFSSPVVGHSSGAMLGGMSLQVGIFTLLQYRRLIPLLPVFKDDYADKLVLGLYSVADPLFDLQQLVKIYRVDRVFEDFQKMQDHHKASQALFLEEYDKKKAIARKIASKHDPVHSESSDPGIILEEVVDEEAIAQISSTLELQKVQYQENIDPWAGSLDADNEDKTNLKLKH